MTLDLFPYQKDGAAFLAARRYAALFDEPGTGKTAQLIRGADKAQSKRTLVMCPHIGMPNWAREVTQWARRPSSAILTNYQPTSNAAWDIINYDLVQQSCAALDALRHQHYDLIILDESHALKNHTAARTQNIYGKNGIARNADRCWVATGSPAPNNVAELYSTILALFPQVLRTENASGRTDRLMSYEAFVHQYCRTEFDARGELKIIGSKALEVAKLKDMLRPFMLRRTLKEVLPDLPPLRFSTVTVDPRDVELYIENSHDQQMLWAALQSAIAELTDMQEDDAFIAALELIDGAALATMRRLFGEAKVNYIADMIGHELNSGLEKIVIFYHHKSVGMKLCEKLQRFNASRIDGSIHKRWRQPRIDQFQNDPKERVLLISLDCGATVITLTAASHVFFAECSWTPNTNVQAARRCARLGQRHSVLARFCSLAGSLDERIIAVQARKARSLAHLFDTSENVGEATCH